MLPNRIFFTGVPGSRWSGIAQTLEEIPGFNTSDRTPERTFVHHSFTGHQGAYFGEGMEFDTILTPENIDPAWTEPGGTRIVKSHDWAYMLDDIKPQFPDDWIMLVYRPDMTSYAWWHEAGGFQIKYPNYAAYKDHVGMLAAIARQNQCIMEFGYKHNCSWHHFTPEWIEETFGYRAVPPRVWPDILVTVIK